MLSGIIVNSYNLLAVVFSAIGTISTAYGLAIIGSTVGQPSFYTSLNLAPQGAPGYSHTTRIIAALNGLNSAGAIIGCLYHVWSSEFLGRKKTMIVGCLVLTIGGAICAGAVDIAMFLVGRGVAGIVRLPPSSPHMEKSRMEAKNSLRNKGSGILACVGMHMKRSVSLP